MLSLSIVHNLTATAKNLSFINVPLLDLLSNQEAEHFYIDSRPDYKKTLANLPGFYHLKNLSEIAQ